MSDQTLTMSRGELQALIAEEVAKANATTTAAGVVLHGPDFEGLTAAQRDLLAAESMQRPGESDVDHVVRSQLLSAKYGDMAEKAREAAAAPPPPPPASDPAGYEQ